MAQLHVTRVKREFREIVTSDEVSARGEGVTVGCVAEWARYIWGCG